MIAFVGKPHTMSKGEFHRLAEHVPDDEIDDEVREKLDVIGKVGAPTPASA